MEAARQGHGRAMVRLAQQQRQVTAARVKFEAGKKAKAEQQRQRLATLEKSTAAAHRDIQVHNRQVAEKRAATAALREAERAKLEAKGFNPYLVQRQRDEAARQARESKANAALLEKNALESARMLAAQLAREKAQRKAQRKAEATARPLPHVNVEAGGPRTFCFQSCVELG